MSEITVYYVMAFHAPALHAARSNGLDPVPQDLGKFFEAQHAVAHANGLRERGLWTDVKVEPRKELVTEQHPAHQALFTKA